MVEEFKPEPGWLSQDVERASKHVAKIVANENMMHLARDIANVLKNSNASHNEKFTILTACIAALGAP